MSDGLNGNSANKTQLWLNSPASPRYPLPTVCPTCSGLLTAVYTYLGVFPYIHSGVHLTCPDKHEFTFCFPYHKAMIEGCQIFDSASTVRGYTNRTSPFHKDTPLKPLRLYGDAVFNDGTVKLQLICPVCYYSERVTFAEQPPH